MYQETEKKIFGFSHCWVLLNGKPKWTQFVADLKAGKKRNDGCSSHHQLGWTMKRKILSSRMEEPPCQRITAKSWETSERRQGPPVMPRLQKYPPHGRAFFRHGGTKKRRGTSSCWMRERRGWIGTGRGRRRSCKLRGRRSSWRIKRRRSNESSRRLRHLKKRLQIARDVEDAKIMLTDKNLLDEHAKK